MVILVALVLVFLFAILKAFIFKEERSCES
jgi:hypothetical protein